MEKSFKTQSLISSSFSPATGMALALILTTFLSGCLQTRNEIEESTNKRTVQDSVQNLQKSAADVHNRFSEIENDVRSMTGRIETLENRQQQMSGEMQSGAKSAETERKLALLQEELVRLNTQVADLTNELNAVKAGKAASVVEPVGAKGPLEIADDLYAKKEWRKAVLAYQKFRDQNPKSKRFAKATLRIGQSFLELGAKDDAKIFLEEVVAKFPHSDEAKQAKNLLKKK